MTSSENPWVEVLSQPKNKSTEGIIPYFTEQINKLSEASGGKLNAVFSRTVDVDRLFSPTAEFVDTVSKALLNVASAGSVYHSSDLELQDAGDLYKKNDYCFEIRSDRYRFRVFTIEFDPSYPAVMTIDRGVSNDLAKLYDRYKFEEAEPCDITILDDEDLDRVFNQLLKSEKLIYICNRLMNEAS